MVRCSRRRKGHPMLCCPGERAAIHGAINALSRDQGLAGVVLATANRSAEPHHENHCQPWQTRQCLRRWGFQALASAKRSYRFFGHDTSLTYLVSYPWMLIGAHQFCLSSQLPPSREALAPMMRAGNMEPSSPAIARHLGPS